MKHIGLVLSGGMGKGAYQIGALRALREFFLPSDFAYVSAASIGALNTYSYLTDNLDKAHNIWSNVNLNGERSFILSVLKGSFLQDAISDIVSGKSKVPFYVPLLDLSQRELKYYNLANISDEKIEAYLKASIAMPFYNKGVPIDGKRLYDGAVVDNIPIYPVLKNELDYVIVVYFDDCNYIFENYELDHKIIKLTFPDDKIISNSIQISHASIMYMIEEGYNRTRYILSDIFSNGTEDLEFVYSRIEQRNSELKSNKIRITGDVIVSNMNKLVKRVVRHNKIINGGISHE